MLDKWWEMRGARWQMRDDDDDERLKIRDERWETWDDDDDDDDQRWKMRDER